MFEQELIPRVKAFEEVRKLLAQRKMLPSKVQSMEPFVEKIAEAVSFGVVAINEDNSITQTLMEPIGAIAEFKYSGERVPAALVNRAMAGLAPTDGQARINAYINLYTGKAQMIINQLEASDKEIAESIAFFLA